MKIKFKGVQIDTVVIKAKGKDEIFAKKAAKAALDKIIDRDIDLDDLDDEDDDEDDIDFNDDEVIEKPYDDCTGDCTDCDHDEECDIAGFDCPTDKQDEYVECDECKYRKLCDSAGKLDFNELRSKFMRAYDDYPSQEEVAEIENDFKFFNTLYMNRELLRKVRLIAKENKLIGCPECAMYEECLEDGPQCRADEESTKSES